jgi:hypothetical protein
LAEQQTLNLRVLGSIPRRLNSFSEQFLHFTERRRVVEWFWLRLGCVAARLTVVIKAINGGAVGTWNQVAIRVDRDLDAGVSELFFDVHD